MNAALIDLAINFNIGKAIAIGDDQPCLAVAPVMLIRCAVSVSNVAETSFLGDACATENRNGMGAFSSKLQTPSASVASKNWVSRVTEVAMSITSMGATGAKCKVNSDEFGQMVEALFNPSIELASMSGQYRFLLILRQSASDRLAAVRLACQLAAIGRMCN